MMAIRCLVVTPERTQLDAEVDFLTLPMFDGELGVAHGRAAMIGRLGYGPLRLRRAGVTSEYYIDGGFAQVENDVVSVLTSRAVPIEEMKRDAAEQALADALAMPGGNADSLALRQTALMRARGMLRSSQ